MRELDRNAARRADRHIHTNEHADGRDSLTGRDCKLDLSSGASKDRGMWIARRTLFDGELLQVGHVTARPSSSDRGDVERQSVNILVLPLTGVFAKHDRRDRQVIATPNHVVLIVAGSSYRISYPGGIGDECLTLRFPVSALTRVLPEAARHNDLHSAGFTSDGLLPPPVMLGRNLLWQLLAAGKSDPIEIEELSIRLFVSALQATRRARWDASQGSSAQRLRRIEAVKEMISLRPAQKWTLSRLADLAEVSPYHLARTFREEVGESVYQYVLRARLAKALELVLDSNMELSAIALEAGFSSHSHFTARFRALFGLAPSALRQASSRSIGEVSKIMTAARHTCA